MNGMQARNRPMAKVLACVTAPSTRLAVAGGLKRGRGRTALCLLTGEKICGGTILAATAPGVKNYHDIRNGIRFCRSLARFAQERRRDRVAVQHTLSMGMSHT